MQRTGSGVGTGTGTRRVASAAGGSRGGMLRRATDLSDDLEFGNVYDHRVVMRIVRYLGKYKLLFTLAIIAMCIYTACSVAVPYLVTVMIDGPIAKGIWTGWDIHSPSLVMIAVLFLTDGVIIFLTNWAQLYIMAYIGRGILYTMRVQMVDQMQKLSLSFYDRHEVGRLMSRVQNDVQSLQDVISSSIMLLVTDIFTLFGVVAILFIKEARLTAICLTVIPVLMIVMFVWQSYARKAFIKVRQAISIVNQGLQENISGAKVIQSLSREDVNMRRFDSVNADNFNANISAIRLSGAIMPVTELLMGSCVAMVIFFGGKMVIAGTMTLGVWAGFILYVQRFFSPIQDLSQQYTQLQRAMAGGQRIFEVLDQKPEIMEDPQAVEMPPVNGQIKFDHVNFEYIPGMPVLHDINITVKPGETVALVGSTGAGKSTFVALIGRYYEVSGGSLTIDGIDIRKVTMCSLRRQISVVLQEPFLFSGTVRENILYGRMDATEQEVIDVATAVGAHDFIMRLENGYDTVLQERGRNVSLGQRQLISFARALIADPRIIMLDEATANIDTQTEQIIQRALKRLLKGRTSVIIAHRLSTVHDADRIVVLDHGRIVETGNHHELMEKKGTYYELYTMSYIAAGEQDVQTSDRRRT